ncbi:hypothetical protein GCM10010136_26490 [Limoniibacter endophyticus]|uniref:DUF4167 domain-containing protein n=2 Tax=Limoniibacter endophyticus TaxID=1565040 RepID=A0A8J3DK10_9HYPH|nr:DUF4167 domain-containing protein [Limoniibacter endophyticus]GHC76103.1 hypothetical protein GCM10010136_26490 [Limoniibacter endophyticus]
MRGRNNNNNRRGPNPLTRNYESNGPDVKIRGSAQQVAEKYMTLARDAQSSGDRVMAENYLQHAEHYNRIIAAAQAQQASQSLSDDEDDDADGFDGEFGSAGGNQDQQSQARSDDSGQNNGNRQNNQRDRQNDRQRQPRNERSDHPQRQHQPRPSQAVEDHGSAPQPVIEGTPAEVALEEREAASVSEAPVRRRRRAPVSNPAAEQGTEQVSEQSSDAPAVEVAAAEKKVRRPRRARSTEGEGNAPSDDTSTQKDLAQAD